MCITSCSSETDSDNGVDKITQKLMSNKWIGRNASFDVGDNDHAWVDVESTTLYFTTENSGILYWIQKDYDTDLGNTITKDYSTFTYYVYGNNVRLEGLNTPFNLTLNGSYLEDGDLFFEASPMNSSDYELIKSLGPVTGKCGDNLTYQYNKKYNAIQISGSGDMYDYTAKNQPWHDLYITGVVIDEDVTSIGNNAFKGQPVSGVDWLGNTKVERIGKNAFQGCMLTSIDIPNTVSTIDDEAFAECKYLTEVAFIYGSQLQNIGSHVFYNCNKLKLGRMSFGETIRKIGDNAFFSNSLGNIDFSEGVEDIGTGAFLGTIANTTLTLPNSLKSVGATVFNGKYSKIVIGTDLEEIGKCAFISSASSGSLYINQGVPPTVEDCIIANATDWGNNEGRWTLYVPKGCKSAYSKLSPWNKFKAIYEDASLEGEGTGDDDGAVTDKVSVESKKNVSTRAFTATLYGEIKGVGKNVEVGFIYGVDANLNGNLTSETVKTVANGNFSCEIDALSEQTKYYYRAYADVGGKKYYGEILAFVTGISDSPNYLSYTIDGKRYEMVLVDGYYGGDFYIMQTELPSTSVFKIGGELIEKLNSNDDEGVIKTEMRTFINDIRKKTNIAFRLPTKKEWQYAASGGKNGIGYKYSGSNDIEDVAWYKSNSGNAPHDIVQKASNELDLYDMSGNYAEVTNDTKDIYFVDGDICGGSWKSVASGCTVSSVQQGSQSGKLPNSRLKEKNAFDARYCTIRLVYSKNR